MSHFDNLGLPKAANEGEQLVDEGLRHAAALARVLRRLSNSEDEVLEAGFWRVIDAASRTAAEAVGRAPHDAEGRHKDLDRQEGVGIVVAGVLGEAAARSEVWAQQLEFAARTLHPEETGPRAHEAGLEELGDIGRAAVFIPGQIS